MSGPERLIVGFTARGRLGERQRPSGAWGALGLLVSAGCMVAAPEDDAALARRDANVARPDARIDALSLPPVLPPREGFCDSPFDCDDGLLCPEPPAPEGHAEAGGLYERQAPRCHLCGCVL